MVKRTARTPDEIRELMSASFLTVRRLSNIAAAIEDVICDSLQQNQRRRERIILTNTRYERRRRCAPGGS
jgi:hypothetical protein